MQEWIVKRLYMQAGMKLDKFKTCNLSQLAT